MLSLGPRTGPRNRFHVTDLGGGKGEPGAFWGLMPMFMLLPCSGVLEELPPCSVCLVVTVGRVRGPSSATGSPLQGQGETGLGESGEAEA